MNAQLSANFITMQNIINCYIRETGKGVWQPVSEMKSEETLVLRLEKTAGNSLLSSKVPFSYRTSLVLSSLLLSHSERGAQGGN